MILEIDTHVVKSKGWITHDPFKKGKDDKRRYNNLIFIYQLCLIPYCDTLFKSFTLYIFVYFIYNMICRKMYFNSS